MAEKKEKLELNGWDYNNLTGDFTDTATVSSLYKNFEDENPGNVITHAAAEAMVDKFFWQKELERLKSAGSEEEEQLILDQTAAITFSKRLLLLILSQADCEGIRFYVCRRPEPVDSKENYIRSLVMVGTDKHFKDLGTTPQSRTIIRGAAPVSLGVGQNTIIGEVGGHDTLRSLNEKLGLGLI